MAADAPFLLIHRPWMTRDASSDREHSSGTVPIGRTGDRLIDACFRRTHRLVSQPGWEEIADFAIGWVDDCTE